MFKRLNRILFGSEPENTVIVSRNSVFINGVEVSGTSSEVLRTTGRVTSKKIPLSPWSEFALQHHFGVQISCIPSGSLSAQLSEVEIYADEAVLPYLEAKVVGSALRIGYTSSISILGDDAIKILAKTSLDLEKVSVLGSGDLEVQGLHQPQLHASLAGSGDLRLSGELEALKLDLAGSGDIKGKNLHVKRCVVKLAGSGDISIRADTISGSLMGSGNLRIPKSTSTANVSCLGSCSISFLADK